MARGEDRGERGDRRERARSPGAGSRISRCAAPAGARERDRERQPGDREPDDEHDRVQRELAARERPQVPRSETASSTRATTGWSSARSGHSAGSSPTRNIPISSGEAECAGAERRVVIAALAATAHASSAAPIAIAPA